MTLNPYLIFGFGFQFRGLSDPDSFSGFWISVSDIEILELGIVKIAQS